MIRYDEGTHRHLFKEYHLDFHSLAKQLRELSVISHYYSYFYDGALFNKRFNDYSYFDFKESMGRSYYWNLDDGGDFFVYYS